MRARASVVVVLAAAGAVSLAERSRGGEERALACPLCRRAGAPGATKCEHDGAVLVEADLVVFHATLERLGREAAEGEPWLDLVGPHGEEAEWMDGPLLELVGAFAAVRSETRLAPYLLASAPPLITTTAACPSCLVAVSGERCTCGCAPVAAAAVAVQTGFAYLAKLRPKLGTENPFAELLDQEGGVDVSKLERLVARYRVARVQSKFGVDPAAPPLLVHPAIEHARDLIVYSTLEEIEQAQERLHEATGRFGALAAVVSNGYVGLGGSSRRDFVFATAPSRSKPQKFWFATATPRRPALGDAWYFVNHAGGLYKSPCRLEVDREDCAVPAGARPVSLASAPEALSGAEREGCAMGLLRLIAAAEAMRGVGATGRAGTLEELAADDLIRAPLADGAKDGYSFEIAVAESGTAFCATARPLAGSGARRSFAVDETGRIFESERPIEVDAKIARPRGAALARLPEPRVASNAFDDIALSYWWCGMERFYDDHWLDALELIEIGIALGGGRVTDWQMVGQTYLKLGSAPSAHRDEGRIHPLLFRAEECLRKGIAIENTIPGSSTAYCWSSLARVHMAMADQLADAASSPRVALLETATEEFAEAIRLDHDHADAWLDLGRVLVHLCDLTDGREQTAIARRAVAALDRADEGAHSSAHHSLVLLVRAFAKRSGGRHAECFLDALELAETPESVDGFIASVLGDEAAAAANELDELPGRRKHLEDAAECTEAERELEQARAASARLTSSLPLLEKLAAEAHSAQTAAALLRGAARIELHVLQNPGRARRLYGRALEGLPDGGLRKKLEAERDSLPE